jgi:hypothetical protein
VFKIPRNRPWPPTLDLATVRETLMYMRGDLRRVPGLEKAAGAIDTAISEIEEAEAKSKPISYETKFSRFLPSRH